jgi:dTDP-glucose 4,6-dehydratase
VRILVTGGLGFIGSNFIHYILKTYSDCKIVNMDKMTYAADIWNLKPIPFLVLADRYTGWYGKIGDISKAENFDYLCLNYDYIINFAAETHVDNSIKDSSAFIQSNIIGVHNILEFIRKYSPKTRLVQVSTDEVYGMLPIENLNSSDAFTEDSPLHPNSPYAASKTAADLLVQSYVHTYGLDCVITRCSNNYGPRQHVEKFLPKAITNILNDKKVPVYGNGSNVRDWIYVEDHCRAIDQVMQKGVSGSVYNVGGDCEKSNLEMLTLLCSWLHVSMGDYLEFVSDRPGHDLRYAMNHDKLTAELGWEPKVGLDVGLAKTIEWYRSKNGNTIIS